MNAFLMFFATKSFFYIDEYRDVFEIELLFEDPALIFGFLNDAGIY